MTLSQLLSMTLSQLLSMTMSQLVNENVKDDGIDNSITLKMEMMIFLMMLFLMMLFLMMLFLMMMMMMKDDNNEDEDVSNYGSCMDQDFAIKCWSCPLQSSFEGVFVHFNQVSR